MSLSILYLVSCPLHVHFLLFLYFLFYAKKPLGGGDNGGGDIAGGDNDGDDSGGGRKEKKKEDKNIYQPFCRRQRKTNIGDTIRIGQEIRCLPYAGFFYMGMSETVHFNNTMASKY